MAMCYFPRIMVGLLVLIGLIALIRRSLRAGQIWGGNVGFFIRTENSLGFWSAIAMYMLLAVSAWWFVWLDASRSCATSL